MARCRVSSGMKRIGIVLMALALSMPAYGAAPAHAALDTEVTLGLGQAVVLTGEDLSVGFDAVRSDSRCPPDVQCVWEGDATVAVSLAHPATGPRTVVDLHTNGRFQRSTEYAGYQVELRALNTAGDTLTLRVTAP